MIWVFIIIIIWVIYVIFEIRIKKHSRVLELPEFTINIAGKIYYEEDEEYEHEVIVVLYQNELKTVIGIESEKYIKVERTVILAIEDIDKVGVYLDALRIGYLNKDSAKEFCNFIKTKKLLLNDGFEVDAVIMGNLEGDKWLVQLSMPSKLQKFRFKLY
ncbi:hypothetical protein ABFY41_11400 [Acinetobacter haemolyticus]|uniref:hypothetical protein n=1 Tax=Acinetobacter haemolyticus TaxID=29430 RepID=UPI003D19DC8C